MSDADPSSDAMRCRIEASLARVEAEQGVRVLLAAESGRRAWGFPSRDSDWDVRFIYLRPLAAYLAIQPASDVIEAMLPDALDMSGWDLRKALGLLVRSNAVVLEWLASPGSYRREAVSGELAELACAAAHLPAPAWHYDRLARRHWTLAKQQPVPQLKTVFYALRPALALAWMRTHCQPPPMDLPSLMSGLVLPHGLAAAIDELREVKLAAAEADAAPMDPQIDGFLSAMLSDPGMRPEPWDWSLALAMADALFCRLLLEHGSRAHLSN